MYVFADMILYTYCLIDRFIAKQQVHALMNICMHTYIYTYIQT